MLLNYSKIKVIAFDADDTLWENENFFREAEQEFYSLMKNYADASFLEQKLFQTEIGHLSLYGYGIKSFILSMIETALKVSKNELSQDIIAEIIQIGKRMLKHPVRLLEGVESSLKYLSEQGYILVVATKGDLLDQERKLKQSGLLDYFHHIEVMTDKQDVNYRTLLKHLNIEPSQLLMVGNSLKSDILPVIKLGAQAIHIPYHTTWVHEELAKTELSRYQYLELGSLLEIRSKV